jgi:hypothetical protein
VSVDFCECFSPVMDNLYKSVILIMDIIVTVIAFSKTLLKILLKILSNMKKRKEEENERLYV